MNLLFQVSLLSLFLLPLNAGLWADTIYLLNGESLQGTFLGQQKGYYKFQTQDGKVHCILREETHDIRAIQKPKINPQKIEAENSVVCGESKPPIKEELTPEGKPLPKEGLTPEGRPLQKKGLTPEGRPLPKEGLTPEGRPLPKEGLTPEGRPLQKKRLFPKGSFPKRRAARAFLTLSLGPFMVFSEISLGAIPFLRELSLVWARAILSIRVPVPLQALAMIIFGETGY